MEALLDLYQAPPDPARPLLCFDESGTALQADVRTPWPARPGSPRRIDTEYRRERSANLFLAVAPHLGWRWVQVSTQRTSVDFALAIRDLVAQFPEAERLTVVLDNLNTHTIGALYTTFPHHEAHRIARKLDLRYTPKHGSWLNIAEGELSVLSRQCLHRRIATRSELETAVQAWVTARNAARIGVAWHFGVTDARQTLHRIYPVPICDT